MDGFLVVILKKINKKKEWYGKNCLIELILFFRGDFIWGIDMIWILLIYIYDYLCKI